MPSTDIILRSRLKLGKQLIEAKRFDEALPVYQQICAKRKNDAESWLTLGAINGMLKRHADAAACCSKAVALAPNHAGAWYNLGIALRDTGQTAKAADALRRTLSLDPRHEGAATSLGHVLAALHRYDEAEEVFRGVLDYQPGNAEFYVVYGSAMQTMGRYEAAISAYRKAIELRHPQIAEILENMAAAFCLQGKFAESLSATDTALRSSPGNLRLYSGRLLTLQYLLGKDAQSILDDHRRWPGNALSPVSGVSKSPRNRADRLRIGYVSSDFRRHSVAYFVEPLLANHNASRFEVTCYFSHQDADATTERLRGLAHRWRNVFELDDSQFRQLIASDEIDILVDLNGHTAGTRLAVFALRAAPVQVSFIGYPDTTGVTEMDFRLSDAIADPPGTEHMYTETLSRLPGCFLCYAPSVSAPEIAPLPSERNGYITFGSFNNLAKINSEVIGVWARLLQSLGNSRLIIKNPSLTDMSTRERYQRLFADVGIPSERLDLIGFVPDNAGHLGAYSRVDIALDTFPYNGTTTTCEALWMGVPVVNLRGHRHSGRVGGSLLTAVGHPEWIADTADHYIDIAQSLARDTLRLAQIRSGLRSKMKGSVLCSSKDYVKAVEAAYEEMIAG